MFSAYFSGAYFPAGWGYDGQIEPGAMSAHPAGMGWVNAYARAYGLLMCSIAGGSSLTGTLVGHSDGGYVDISASIHGVGSLSATAVKPMTATVPAGGNGYGPGARTQKKLWEIWSVNSQHKAVNPQHNASTPNTSYQHKAFNSGPIASNYDGSDTPETVVLIGSYGLGATQAASNYDSNSVKYAAVVDGARVVAKREIQRIEAEAKAALLDAEMEEALLMFMMLED